MIATRAEVNEIRDSELDELVVKGKPPPVGSVQPVKAGQSNQPACHVKVLDVWPCVHGGHVVRFELTADPKPVVRKRVESPRLLKPGGGYTTNPDHAMRDPSVPPDDEEAGGVPHPYLSAGEPESVPAHVQREYSERGVSVHALRERAQREQWDQLEARSAKLRDLEGMLAEKHVDVSGDLRLIDRALRSIERKLHGHTEAA